MHAYHELRVSNGGDVVKYYGKWPFTRVLGCQEIMSVVFSIANAIPHIHNFKWYRQAVPASYPLRNWWSAYALISINTVCAVAIPMPSPHHCNHAWVLSYTIVVMVDGISCA
jgi:hypothetical protein